MSDDILPEDDDFFGQYQNALQRDRYDRPLILLPDGSKRVPYTRASTVSDYISSSGGLTKWKMRGLAKGIGDREDLAALAAALPPLVGDRDEDRPTNLALDEIIERALEAAGHTVKTDWGTAIHGFTDPTPSGPVPKRMVSDVQAYERRMAGLEHVMGEVFVVNDELQVAGTFDAVRRLVARPDVDRVGWCRIEDKKTGHYKPYDVAIQMGCYANSQIYDPETDERSPLPEGMDLAVALLAHIPRGKGACDLYEIDIARGYLLAKIAISVRDQRKTAAKCGTKAPDYFMEERLELSYAIGEATSREELLALASTSPFWNEEATALAKKRMDDLGVQYLGVVR